MSVAETIYRIRKKTDYLFRKRKGGFIIPKKIRISAEILLIMGLFVLNGQKLLHQQRLHIGKLSSTLTEIEGRAARIASIRSDTKSLSNKLDELRQKIPFNTYSLLSELADIFNNNTVMLSFILQNRYFQIEGESQHPLELMEQFRQLEAFENVKLTNMVPVRNTDRERFKLSGSFNAQ